MQNNYNRWGSLAKLFSLLLLVYTICRLLFYFFNFQHFSEIEILTLIKLFFFGLRFDTSAIIAVNSLFILLYLLPKQLHAKKGYGTLLKYVFIVTNAIAFLANCVDWIYFRYTLKRTTWDVFSFISTETDFVQLIPVFVIDFWYVLLIWGVFCFVTLRLYKKWVIADVTTDTFTIKQGMFDFLTLTIGTVLSIIGFRGGLQLIPIYNVTAAEYTEAKNIPIVLNTPFSIIKTADLPDLNEKKYFDETTLKTIYSPYRKGNGKEKKNKNIVILILESFSREYIGYFNHGKGYTPFLDSIMQQSLVYTNAFANGKKSSEGIPAILAGIPTLMNEPYLSSIYGSNTINSLASLLKKEGYTSAFYHGGTNGTMNFKEFCSIAGFDHYYGRSEYNNEADYDGNWGIWDEPFLHYFAKQLNLTQQPFVASLFTLTSHHPYNIPEQYKTVFKDEGLKIHKCIRYTDYSLKNFFDAVCKTNWYANTLFVITADHTGISESNYYSNYIGQYQIPIIFFDPERKTTGIDSTLAQQIDIMPGVLDYLGYSKPYFSFGSSLFDSTLSRFNVNYINNTYQLINNNYLLEFDGQKPTALYKYKTDSLVKKNILTENPVQAESITNTLKAYIQTYNSCLINNKMRAE